MAALRDPAVAARVEALAERFAELREDMRDTFAGAREFLDFIQHWAAVVATQLEDTTTAQATITALVQRTLGLEGLGSVKIQMDYPRRRCWILCPRGAALRVMEALRGHSIDCKLSTSYPAQLVGAPSAMPPRLPSVLCYKLVARHRGRFVSIYDGETEYRLGETVAQTARPGHHGGFYVFRTAAQALDAPFPTSSKLKGATKALLLVEAGEPCYEYRGGKLACSSITPIEVVLRRVKKAAWKV